MAVHVFVEPGVGRLFTATGLPARRVAIGAVGGILVSRMTKEVIVMEIHFGVSVHSYSILTKSFASTGFATFR
jgi:hypothetical protein